MKKKRNDLLKQVYGVVSPLEFMGALAPLIVGFILLFATIAPIIQPYEPVINKANLQNSAAIIAERLISNPGYDSKGESTWVLNPEDLSYLGIGLSKPLFDAYYYRDGTVEVILDEITEIDRIDLSIISLTYSPGLVPGGAVAIGDVPEGEYEEISIYFTVKNLGSKVSDGFDYVVKIDDVTQGEGSRDEGVMPGEQVNFVTYGAIPSDLNSHVISVTITPHGRDDNSFNNHRSMIIYMGTGGGGGNQPDIFCPVIGVEFNYEVSWREASGDLLVVGCPCDESTTLVPEVTVYYTEYYDPSCDPTGGSGRSFLAGSVSPGNTITVTTSDGRNYGYYIPNVDCSEAPCDEDDDSCFIGDTEILMADGSTKSIRDVKVGDEVKSFDEKEGLTKTGVVKEVYHHSPCEMGDYYILINDEIGVTPNHLVLLDGKWIDAGKLRVGEKLGNTEIKSMKLIYKKVPTYNLEVEPYHNYYVAIANSTSIAHNALAYIEDAQLIKSTTGGSDGPDLAQISGQIQGFTGSSNKSNNSIANIGTGNNLGMASIALPTPITLGGTPSTTNYGGGTHTSILQIATPSIVSASSGSSSPNGEEPAYTVPPPPSGSNLNAIQAIVDGGAGSLDFGFYYPYSQNWDDSPIGGTTTHYKYKYTYSGVTKEGNVYNRITIISDNSEYIMIDPQKIIALSKLDYETVAKPALLGSINLPKNIIGNVEFNIKITTLDNIQLLDYGKQYSGSSSILAQYTRAVTIYYDKSILEPLGYKTSVPAILQVTVFV